MMDVLSPREAVETVKRYMNDLRLPFSVSYGEPKGDPAEVPPQSYSVPIELKRKDGASFIFSIYVDIQSETEDHVPSRDELMALMKGINHHYVHVAVKDA